MKERLRGKEGLECGKAEFSRAFPEHPSLGSYKLRRGNRRNSLVGECTLVVTRINGSDDIEIGTARSH